MMESSYGAPAVSMAATPVPPRRLALRRLFAAVGGFVEHALVFLILLAVSDALLPHFVGGGAAAESVDGNPALRRVTIAAGAVSLLLCAIRWRSWWRVARRDSWTLLLVGLALLSLLWSELPEVSLRRGLVLLSTSAFGVFLAARYSPPALLRVLAAVLGASALLSLFFALALPSMGVASGVHRGAWQGVYTQKNTLGIMMAVSTLVFLLAWRQASRRRWLLAIGASLSALLLVRSTSATSLVIVATVLVLLPLFRLLRSRHSLAVPTLIFAVLLMGGVATMALVNREAVLNALGRDPTLTGRTELWRSVLQEGSQRPWLGHGYSAFWMGAESPGVAIWRAVGWEAPNSHNGYLDLWLELGLVGLGLFALSLLMGGIRAIRLARSVDGAAALWPLVYLSAFVLYNMTEGIILSSSTLLWVLYVASVASAATYARSDARVPRPPARTADALRLAPPSRPAADANAYV